MKKAVKKARVGDVVVLLRGLKEGYLGLVIGVSTVNSGIVSIQYGTESSDCASLIDGPDSFEIIDHIDEGIQLGSVVVITSPIGLEDRTGWLGHVEYYRFYESGSRWGVRISMETQGYIAEYLVGTDALEVIDYIPLEEEQPKPPRMFGDDSYCVAIDCSASMNAETIQHRLAQYPDWVLGADKIVYYNDKVTGESFTPQKMSEVWVSQEYMRGVANPDVLFKYMLEHKIKHAWVITDSSQGFPPEWSPKYKRLEEEGIHFCFCFPKFGAPAWRQPHVQETKLPKCEPGDITDLPVNVRRVAIISNDMISVVEEKQDMDNGDLEGWKNVFHKPLIRSLITNMLLWRDKEIADTLKRAHPELTSWVLGDMTYSVELARI